MSIIHKCYCGHTDTCNCGMDAEIIMKKFISKESTIFWINELVRVRSIEYAEWAEDYHRLLGLSGDDLYREYLNRIDNAHS